MERVKAATPRGVSEAYWAAECERDVDAVMAFYHDDAVYQDAGGVYLGNVAIRTAYERSATEFPGLEVHILRAVSNGNVGALEFVAWLTDTLGRRHIVRGVNVVEIEKGRFRSVRSYEDPPAEEPSAGSDPATSGP
jgi:hypothetical protein